VGRGGEESAGQPRAAKWVLDIFSFQWSLFASTSNDTNKNHHDRDDQEGMNESAHGVRGDNTQKPEDNHDDCNGLEHVASPFAVT